MSNVEAREPHTLPATASGSFRRRGITRGGWHVSEADRRRLIIAAGRLSSDVVWGCAAIAMVGAVVTGLNFKDDIGLAEWLRQQIPVMLPLLIGINCLMGVYGSGTRGLMERFRVRSRAALMFAFAGMLAWGWERLAVEAVSAPVVGTVVLVLGCWTEYAIQAWLLRSGAWGVPTAVLGSGTESRALARLLLSQPAWGVRPVGFIDLDSSNGGKPAAFPSVEDDRTHELPVLGTLEGWRGNDAVEIVIAPDSRTLPQDPTRLHRLGVRHILVVNQLGDLAFGDCQVRHFDRFVALELCGRPNGPSDVVKRVMDLAVAVPLAVVAAPVIGVLALVIKFVDPGPAFHHQRRIGRYGRSFDMPKLRTMYRDAEDRLRQVLATDAAMREEWRRYFKLSKDPRILPRIGNLLRRTSLDELPQLWNIISGDMSLVGPRPFPAYHVDAFDPEFQELRRSVPPGLTGLWQVSSRSSGDLEVQRSQDSYYIRNRSLWLDLFILVATLPAVIGGRGAK